MPSSHQAIIKPNLRRGLYIALMVPALVIVLIGTLGKQDEQVLIAIAAPYLLWLLLFVIFVWLHLLELAMDSKFFISCIYHLLCIGAVMTFLHSLQASDNYTLLFWTPIAIQIGIFLAVGVRECASVSWGHIRGLLLALWFRLQRYMLILIDGLRHLLIWSLNGLLRLLLHDEDERLPAFHLTSNE